MIIATKFASSELSEGGVFILRKGEKRALCVHIIQQNRKWIL